MTGDQFRAAREVLGISRTEMAWRLGVDRSTVWRYEQYQRKVPGPVARLVDFELDRHHEKRARERDDQHRQGSA